LIAAAFGADPRELRRPSQMRYSTEAHDDPVVKYGA
jgi:hypothetical protein